MADGHGSRNRSGRGAPVFRVYIWFGLGGRLDRSDTARRVTVFGAAESPASATDLVAAH